MKMTDWSFFFFRKQLYGDSTATIIYAVCTYSRSNHKYTQTHKDNALLLFQPLSLS